MNRRLLLFAFAISVALIVPSTAMASGASHYVPQPGDRFAYSESVLLTNGRGNYSSYTEEGYYNGSITVTGVQSNGTENASYQSAGIYQNSLGQEYPWSEAGSFTFSAVTFLYVQGTDNQTGYVDPYVWFYIDNGLARGSSFSLLDTAMTVVSTDDAFPLALSSTGYVSSIFAEGNGSYLRNDAYGVFNAVYNWKAYFDPGTGYILGYVYTEVDSDAAGDGFALTDTVTDTQTTFALTSTTAPSSGSTSGSTLLPWTLVVGLVIVAIVVIAVVIAVVVARRRRGHRAIPQHPSAPARGTMPTYAPPPPVNLIPRDQPPVQQVVIRETVKVPCQYCGTLIDSTATVCPRCGATRT